MRSSEKTNICIYCLKRGDQSMFQTVEHVVPQSFGHFQNNFTLKKMVCNSCNQFFGRDLELILARDSKEGFDRFKYGLKPENEFKSFGKSAKSKIQIQNGR